MDLLPTNISAVSLSNDSNLVAQAFRIALYVQPIHFFLSLTTNIVNIRVLCSRALRSSPCAHYFLAYAVFSIAYSCALCPTQVLRHFSIVWINDVFNCKISNYVLYLIPYQANLMLNLASFDRYYSSLRVRTPHSRSAVRSARIAIVLGNALVRALHAADDVHLHVESHCASLLTPIGAFNSRVYLPPSELVLRSIAVATDRFWSVDYLEHSPAQRVSNRVRPGAERDERTDNWRGCCCCKLPHI